MAPRATYAVYGRFFWAVVFEDGGEVCAYLLAEYSVMGTKHSENSENFKF